MNTKSKDLTVIVSNSPEVLASYLKGQIILDGNAYVITYTYMSLPRAVASTMLGLATMADTVAEIHEIKIHQFYRALTQAWHQHKKLAGKGLNSSYALTDKEHQANWGRVAWTIV